MKLVAISLPRFAGNEAEAIVRLFEEGLELFHLRKPGCEANEMRVLLNKIPEKYYTRIVLHDLFSLAKEKNLKGVHLNSRNRKIPENFTGSISRSCHSLEEIVESDYCNYVFLSPIFNSISKEGYGSCFSADMLRDAEQQGVLSERVIALGGIDELTIPQIRDFSFGGVAVLGALWREFELDQNINQLTERLRLLQMCSKR